MDEFIKENKIFWSQFTINNNGKKLLVEEPIRPDITHANAIFVAIINQARGYSPVWLYNKHCQKIELLQSYFPGVNITIIQKKLLVRKFRVLFIVLIKFLKIYFTKDILKFSYNGVKYGDIIYDAYLSKYQVATIRKIDTRIIKLIAFCIFRHIKIRNILQNDDYAGVLVSHQIGISSGVMLRVALAYGYQGYLRCGHHQATLQRFESIDEVYDYEYKPLPFEIRLIIKRLRTKNLEKVFLKVSKKQIGGEGDQSISDAFSQDKHYYTNRKFFNQDYHLDSNKKNIFVMLHAFNDYPHSHFRWMIFKDYYDWFIQTLKFAKKDKSVNWIFKQHPSIKHYITKDISFKEIFSKCPENIIYIDENNQIDTQSLIYCADLIVTCLGSAGFELPALGAIPSVTAGDNFYTQLGFAIEPKSREEYYDVLSNVSKIEKLSSQQQKIAKATYIYIYQFSRVRVSVCPMLSLDKGRDKNINYWYWKKVTKLYQQESVNFLNEVQTYIKDVSKSDFKKLNSFKEYCTRHNL
jgi:hypothetical protein